MKINIKLKYTFLLFAFIILCSIGCKRQDDFLNTKQKINQVVPKTIDDFQALLDDYSQMNDQFPSLGLASSDNFYVPDTKLSSASTIARATYLWQKDIFQGASSTDWNMSYTIIEHCNIALDGLGNITPNQSNQSQFNNVKGSALFFRTLTFYMLSQDFCKPYISSTANTDLGIVLRLTSDVNQTSTRSTVQQTYNQMISDLQAAIPLLPVAPQYPMRPSQPSANALLAKIYLSMGDYANAAVYATNSLNQFSTLLDYNSSLVSPTTSTHFPPYPNNPEISFFSYEIGGAVTLVSPSGSANSVDSILYNSYDPTDLRKRYFYSQRSDKSIGFAGTYTGTFYNFCGIATDEVYLIRAEASSRTGNLSGALSDLNTLLSKRYVTGTFTPIVISDPNALLSKILLERRKELAFTGQLRWEDLRRLNLDPKFAVTLTRVSNGITYTLPPNDPRYVLPIPDNEIQLSGIQQNPR